MRRHWVLSLVLAVGAALVAAPAAHAGDGCFTNQDLTASIGAPLGNMQPAGWSTPWDLQRHFAYYTADSRLVVASAAPGGAWTWTTLLKGEPVYGFLGVYSYSWDHSSRIVYADGVNHHLMEMWSSDTSPAWQKIDLTATHNGPLVDGGPHGYEQDGQQHIVFMDGHGNNTIWEAVFVPGADWTFTNLTTLTGVNPRNNYGSYLTAQPLQSDGEAIGYIGADDYPHVLIGQRGRWLDQRVGVPADKQYYNVNSMAFLRGGHVQRYAFRYETSDRHLHEAAWEAGRWTDTDVTVVTGSTDPNGQPRSGDDEYLWNADGSEHMFTTGSDGAVLEYVRTRDGRWFLWRDTGPIVDGPAWVAGFAAPDDAAHGTETEFYVYYTSDRHVIISDLTGPYQT
ncbi:hypothetical protein [Kutzneria sp. NPDC051319]|uniref:hypothetical protein n=1 Tax=Kutzneria sp. NPDC051319 TaxID=3155047 RepID=UPI0034453F38